MNEIQKLIIFNIMDQQQLELINQISIKIGYKAVKKISQGSYGQVYQVICLVDEKPYAMKILDRKKLIKVQKQHQGIIEGLILQKLKHPGIVQFKQMIVLEQYILHIMELCPYGTIFQLLKKISKNIALATKKAAIMMYYLSQILETLDYLHQNNIIHRDLKPQNIVIGSDMRIRIVDFASCKVTSQNFFSTAQLAAIQQSRKTYGNCTDSPRKSFVGSPHYLSPQGTKCLHTTSSDIWAFGVIVYKFFHGKHPFNGQNNYAIFQKIKNQQVQLSETIPPNIRQIIISCLKKEPEQRPNIKFLKLFQYFKEVHFDTVFKTNAPLTHNDIQNQLENTKTLSKTKFQQILQKRMFFGNFKPRILSIFVKQGNLYMAYKYVDTKVIKNEFVLSMNDYAEQTSKNEFLVASQDMKYHFKVSSRLASEVVTQINYFIRTYYNIE